jgi:hypothetical protein
LTVWNIRDEDFGCRVLGHKEIIDLVDSWSLELNTGVWESWQICACPIL